MKIRLLLLLAVTMVVGASWPQRANLTHLDVGQGLAVLFTDDTGWQLLYDGGPGSAILPELAKQMPIADNKIEVLALSHTHRDHLEGLIEVLKRYDVDEVWVSGDQDSSDVYRAWQTALEQSGATVKTIATGWQRYLASGWKIRALHPPKPPVGEHAHDSDVVLQISRADRTILLTGDLEAENELAILEHCETSRFSGCQPQNVWLQVSHHGSRNTTTDDWLDYWQPKIAVISAGADNRYQHPHPETLERLEKHQVPYKRTDWDGTVTLQLTPSKP